jgi:hypothetical protein
VTGRLEKVNTVSVGILFFFKLYKLASDGAALLKQKAKSARVSSYLRPLHCFL